MVLSCWAVETQRAEPRFRNVDLKTQIILLITDLSANLTTRCTVWIGVGRFPQHRQEENHWGKSQVMRGFQFQTLSVSPSLVSTTTWRAEWWTGKNEEGSEWNRREREKHTEEEKTEVKVRNDSREMEREISSERESLSSEYFLSSAPTWAQFSMLYSTTGAAVWLLDCPDSRQEATALMHYG